MGDVPLFWCSTKRRADTLAKRVTPDYIRAVSDDIDFAGSSPVNVAVVPVRLRYTQEVLSREGTAK